MDFDLDPIEKGHKHYSLFMKRKSFEHVRELLPEQGKGIAIPCDLDLLITRVHVSPHVADFVSKAIE